jgi:hypothetical protein
MSEEYRKATAILKTIKQISGSAYILIGNRYRQAIELKNKLVIDAVRVFPPPAEHIYGDHFRLSSCTISEIHQMKSAESH